MDRQTFTWDRSENRIRRNNHWLEGLWLVGLLLAALLLYSVNLDSLSLFAQGEGVVERMARQLADTPSDSWQWFYPIWDEQPELVHPPLLAWLIASLYQITTVSMWATRLPGAILCALSVPLLYSIGRELFPSRQKAIFSCLIYLTLLPVVQYGRLAIVDGATLCFIMLTMWCVLRSRRDFRFSLGIGAGLGLICLSKGLLLGALVLAIAIAFLGWDTPRLLSCVYWWGGILLGNAPALTWYGVGLLHSQQTAQATLTIITHSLKPLWSVTSEGGSSPIYYFVEIVKFSAPWFLFFPYGLRLAWENRNWGWAKLVLIWSGIYFLVISLSVTKLPWYVLPLYPALALAVGNQLTEVWNWPTHKSYPRVWSVGLILMSLVTLAMSIYLSIVDVPEGSVLLICASVILTLMVSALLIARRDRQFILILFWGMYVSLLLLMSSSTNWLNFGVPSSFNISILGG